MAGRLRDDLLRRLLLPMATILLVSGMLSYQLAFRFANRSYDKSLLEDARALARIVKDAGSGERFALPATALEMLEPGEGDRIYFQLRSLDRGILAGDPDLPLPKDADFSEPFFFDGSIRTTGLRIVVFPLPDWSGGDTRFLMVGETRLRRESLAGDIVAAVVAPQLALIFFSVVVIIGGIASGLKPLETLAVSLGARRRDELTPLPHEDIPAEALPLIDAFNGLLRRLAEVLAAQQRFVADAAHQLRTPLAALKLQLEQALRQPDDGRRQELLHQLAGSVDRTARLSGQLLLLARAEPGGGPMELATVDLRALALEVGSQWIPRSLQLGRDLGFSAGETPVVVAGDRVMLAELLANLLDNALRYGGPNVTLRVVSEDGTGGPELIVEDDGAGIPPEEASRVFERFHRVPGTIGDGSGLGLAIVREIAQGHGATVQLDAPVGGGLQVRVRFPRCVSPRGSGWETGLGAKMPPRA